MNPLWRRDSRPQRGGNKKNGPLGEAGRFGWRRLSAKERKVLSKLQWPCHKKQHANNHITYCFLLVIFFSPSLGALKMFNPTCLRPAWKAQNCTKYFLAQPTAQCPCPAQQPHPAKKGKAFRPVRARRAYCAIRQRVSASRQNPQSCGQAALRASAPRR